MQIAHQNKAFSFSELIEPPLKYRSLINTHKTFHMKKLYKIFFLFSILFVFQPTNAQVIPAGSAVKDTIIDNVSYHFHGWGGTYQSTNPRDPKNGRFAHGLWTIMGVVNSDCSFTIRTSINYGSHSYYVQNWKSFLVNNSNPIVEDGLQYSVYPVNADSSVIACRVDRVTGSQESLAIKDSVIFEGQKLGVRQIYDRAFEGKSVKSVVLPDSLVYIGKYAFSNCAQLESINIPSGLQVISDSAFYGCTKLDSLQLNQRLLQIGTNAFEKSGIRRLILNSDSKLSTVGDHTSQKWMIVINIPRNAVGRLYAMGTLMNKYCDSLCINNPNSLFVEKSNFSSWSNIVYLQLNHGTIDKGSFSKFKHLKEADLRNVTWIRSSAFSGCSSLVRVYMPKVEKIESYAFTDCSSLVRVYMPKVEEIESYAFADCSIKDLVLPASLNKLDAKAFGYMYNMNVYDLTGGAVASNLLANMNGNKNNIYTTNSSNYSTAKSPVTIKDLFNIERRLREVVYKYPAQEMKIDSFYSTTSAIVSSDSAKISNLSINGRYRYPVRLKFQGKYVYEANLSVSAKQPYLWFSYERTQTTLKVYMRAEGDVSARVSKIDVYDEYGNRFLGTIPAEGGYLLIRDLKPGEALSIKPEIYFDDVRTVGPYYWSNKGSYTDYRVETHGIFDVSKIRVDKVGPNWSIVKADYVHEDAEVVETGINSPKADITKIDENTYHIGGLSPNMSYSVVYYVKLASGDIIEANSNAWKNLKTESLQIETVKEAKSLSNTTAIICAQTNLDEYETRAGFEWRRYDAPELVPSSRSNCPIVDGVMMGALKNLSANTYYKFRPYYAAADGKEYFGDWSAFGTADAYVYFDPTVRTYEVSNIQDNRVTVKGFAIAGSDVIEEQGFEYWEVDDARSLIVRAVSNEKNIILTNGQWMTATIDNLVSGKTYAVRAFVKTAKGSTYGNTEVFSTTNTTGIGHVCQPNEELMVKIVAQNQSSIKVCVDGMQGNGRYQLFSMNGTMLSNGTLSNSDEVQNISLSRLDAGIYLLKVSDNIRTKTIRLVIK